MNTSIVIITYNREPLLKHVLDPLGQQMEEDDQLVVVDDGSTDGTEPMVRKQVPGVTYLKIPRHHGYKLSTRINQGLELARHDMVWRLDSDCMPVDDCLKMLKRAFIKDRIIAGGILYQDEQGQIDAPDHFWRLEFMEEMAHHSPKEFHHWRKTGEVFHPVLCFGGNICFSREKALAVRGFDPDFDGAWGSEDAWFADRMMWQLSVKVFYIPRLAVIHQWHPKVGAHLGEEGRKRNLKLWARKSTDMRSMSRE